MENWDRCTQHQQKMKSIKKGSAMHIQNYIKLFAAY